ncbi:MAG: hypothetical protein WCT35_09425 [Sideroxydans sp.]|jgi:hypothetical protein
MAGRLYSIRPDGDREPIEYTHYQEWHEPNKVDELERVLASWEKNLGVNLSISEGFDSLEQMVHSVGWDNTINLVVYAILCAGFDVYVGSDFIEIYNRTDWE